jgi:hypothetical protein
MKLKRLYLPILLACTLIAGTFTALTQVTPSAEVSDIQTIQGIVGQFSEDEGAMDATFYSITLATAENIENQVAQMQSDNKLSQTDGVTQVISRDWNRYGFDKATQYMSDAESSFYQRLSDLAECYVTDSTLDAYYVSTYDIYTTNGVQYGDLGLSAQRAFYVAEWFLYNNPQYYFLKPSFLTTSSALYPAIHDIFSDGDDRANVTNQLFNKLDAWIASICDNEVTAYEKEVSAHDLICSNTVYAKGDYDQSVYSVLIEGKSVCAGYSEAMTAMLNYVGVSTVTMFSNNHAWNKVQLDDGLYYAVDVTWDDTLNGKYLFNCNDTDICKYDNKSEHQVPSEFASYAPPTSVLSMGNETSDKVPVTVPEGMHIEDNTETTARVVWNAVDGADYYELQAFSNAACTSSLGYIQSKAPSVKLTGLSVGRTIYVKVRACQGTTASIVYSNWTDAFPVTGVAAVVTQQPTVVPTEVPTQEPTPEPTETPTEEPTQTPTVDVTVPVNMRVTEAAETYVKLAWDAPALVSRYGIEVYLDDSLSRRILSTTIGSTSVRLTGMTSGSSKYVRIRTEYDYNGTTYFSDWVGMTITSASSAPTTPIPTVQPTVTPSPTAEPQPTVTEIPPQTTPSVSLPQDVRVTNVTQSKMSIEWSYADNDVTGFYLEISKTSSFNSILASKTIAYDTRKLTISGFNANTNYYFRIKSLGNGCESDWVVVASQTAMTEPVVATLTAPTGFNATKVTSTKYKFSWNVVNGATGYDFEVYKDSSYSSRLASKAMTSTVLNLSGLKSGTTYYIRVRSTGPSGCSDWYQTSITA